MPDDHRLYKYRRGGNKNLSEILFYKATPGVTSGPGFNFEGECIADVTQLFSAERDISLKLGFTMPKGKHKKCGLKISQIEHSTIFFVLSSVPA